MRYYTNGEERRPLAYDLIIETSGGLVEHDTHGLFILCYDFRVNYVLSMPYLIRNVKVLNA